MTVSWTQPAFPNGIIRSYIISVDYYDGRGQITSKSLTGNETFSVTITSNQLGMYVIYQYPPTAPLTLTTIYSCTHSSLTSPLFHNHSSPYSHPPLNSLHSLFHTHSSPHPPLSTHTTPSSTHTPPPTPLSQLTPFPLPHTHSSPHPPLTTHTIPSSTHTPSCPQSLSL